MALKMPEIGETWYVYTRPLEYDAFTCPSCNSGLMSEEEMNTYRKNGLEVEIVEMAKSGRLHCWNCDHSWLPDYYPDGIYLVRSDEYASDFLVPYTLLEPRRRR